MPTYTETRILPFTPQQLFGLVIDIEKYPEFLPWCRAARIVNREAEGAFVGELIISFSHLTERYSSRVVAVAPNASPHRGEDGRGAASDSALGTAPHLTSPRWGEEQGTVDVALVSGPFHHLENHWRFVPHPQGCEIHFAVDFAFKSKWLDKLIGGLFNRASEKMVAAFLARAEALYGNPTLT